MTTIDELYNNLRALLQQELAANNQEAQEQVRKQLFETQKTLKAIQSVYNQNKTLVEEVKIKIADFDDRIVNLTKAAHNFAEERAKNKAILSKIVEEKEAKEKAIELLAIADDTAAEEAEVRSLIDSYAKEADKKAQEMYEALDYNKALNKKRLEQGLRKYHKPLYDNLKREEKDIARMVKEQDAIDSKVRKTIRAKNEKVRIDRSKLAEEEEKLPSLPEMNDSGE